MGKKKKKHKKPNRGWQCPVCMAVMNPEQKVCVNCDGSEFIIPELIREQSRRTDGISSVTLVYGARTSS
jgi:uncharacterized OB-fold protein